MIANFDRAFMEVLEHEGGYVHHPQDPGGETNFGITKRVAEEHGYEGNMRDMPLSVAEEIYRKSYWNPCRCDELPPLVRYPVFDAAVNSGVRQSAKWLQRALGVSDDGIIGPVTIAAANQSNGYKLRSDLIAQRLEFLTNLKQFDVFGKGWTRRVCKVLKG